MMRASFALALLFVVSVAADTYMLYPRGSNNRLNENNRARNNGNRLFDSQNNNRGGVNVGTVYYYAGSRMYIEWTNQHGCGGPNSRCEMIIQYMCDDLLRDGSSTNTIPLTPASDKNPQFGRHESYDWYTTQCLYRQRNRGLFTANQALQGNAAIYTRQNPDGTRRGYECPEERDYYPYWHPTPWRDIIVFTNDYTRCSEYIAHSQNKEGRWYCKAPADWISYQVSMGRTGFIPINQTQCEAIQALYMVDQYNQTLTGQWTYREPWGGDDLQCQQAQFTRDNHLGNTDSGHAASYNWTVPSTFHERCTLRIRYNITTNDYPAWQSDSEVIAPYNLTAANNSRATTNTQRDVALVDVWSLYGISRAEVNASINQATNDPAGTAIRASREYVFKDNPRVDIFGPLIDRAQSGNANTAPSMIRLQLAIDTSQFGRTFQDRSHRFAIRQVPSNLQGKRIHNVQVRGKRGNIVQTFPSTEYDFVPKFLQVQTGEYVHFQWTGNNNNPGNNAGNGAASTDRHNVALLRAPVYQFIQDANAASAARGEPTRIGQLGSNYPTDIDDPSGNGTFLGLSVADQKTLAILQPWQFGGNLKQGDDAGTYFDLGPREVTGRLGVFSYVATRNNDFSNRDQKATIYVSTGSQVTEALGAAGGMIRADSGASVEVPAGAFSRSIIISIVSYSPDTPSSFQGGQNSNFLEITPLVLPLNPGFAVRIKIPFGNKVLVIPQMYRSDSLQGQWSTVDASYSSGVATADVKSGGVYVVQAPVNWGAVVGVAIGGLAFVALCVGGAYYYFRVRNAKTLEVNQK